MAPEQAAGSKQITPAADRCALGLIAFRLLCGRHYFEGDNWVALLREVTRGANKPPSEMGHDLGPAFDVWFAKACAFEPWQRFATCAEQVEALGKALADASVLARWKRAAWRVRRPAGWTALVMGCVVGVLIAVVGRGRDRPAVSATAADQRHETAVTPVRPISTPIPAAVAAEAPPAVMLRQDRTAAAVGSRSAADRPRKRRAGKATSQQPARVPDAIWEEP
jgi:hypothetical protein